LPQMINSSGSTSCPFGSAPAPIKITNSSKVVASGSMTATIADMAPMTNIGPFGLCSSLMNPATASATAAALGVLTPMPCTPVPAGPWSSNAPKVIIEGKPCLCTGAVMQCAYGGTIQIVSPGQAKDMV